MVAMSKLIAKLRKLDNFYYTENVTKRKRYDYKLGLPIQRAGKKKSEELYGD